MFVFAWHCHSCDRGFHLIQHVRFPVAEYFALLLPEGVRCTLSHPGQEVVNRESRGSSRWAQADGDTAVFRDGGAAEVTAGGRSFDPTGFTTGLPLDPLPMQRCLSLCEGSYSISTTASMLCFFFFKRFSVPQHCRSRLWSPLRVPAKRHSFTFNTYAICDILCYH